MLESCQTSGDHLKAGLIGLSSGVFGGMTSIVTQPIKEARSYGVGVSMVGLGLVNMIATMQIAESQFRHVFPALYIYTCSILILCALHSILGLFHWLSQGGFRHHSKASGRSV